MITGYVALLDPQKLGLDLLAYVSVRLEARRPGAGAGRRNVGAGRRDPCGAVSRGRADLAGSGRVPRDDGEMDYLLRVQVEDMAHFSRFVQEHLLHHPSVIDVKTSFSLECFKETTALPIRSVR